MTDDPRLQPLLDELHDSQSTPEQVCADCPELVPQLRQRWKQLHRVESQLDLLFPPLSPADRLSPPYLQVDAELPEVPGYEVEAVLGRGGMGIVYQARHLRLNRSVALKMLLAGRYARPEELERFLQESEAVAGLSHPNIVQLYDAGDVNGHPYFTMELIEGGSLAQKLKGAPLPPRTAAELLTVVAAAVQVAHRAGIIHRDLKPANILLATDGTPKVTDFGLARRLENTDGQTLSGAPLGTPSYMAPEQARGDRSAIGTVSDVYALGAILYELLTGRPPFRAGSSAATLRQVLIEEPVSPTRLNPLTPRDLETISLKCLNKEPSSRYASAAALADDLGRFQRGEPISARRAGPFERFRKWIRRHPGPTIAAASVAVLLILAAIATQRFLWSRAELLRGVYDDLAALERFERTRDWNNAREALERASGRLGERDVSDLRARVRQSERDLQLVADLSAIRLSRAEVAGEKLDLAEASARYETTFDAAGLNVKALPPATVAELIKASPIRNELIAALDDWAVCAKSDVQLKRIYDVARLADPDPGWRDKVRDASVMHNAQALSDLAAAAPIDKESASILVALGHQIDLANGNSVPFCRRVQLQYPNDFWANLLLAGVLQERRSPESISFYLAARAIRPSALIVYVNLSAELQFHGRAAEALEYARRAVVVDPRSAPAHNALGVCLLQLGQYDEAVASCRNALAIDPNNYFAAGVMCQALINDGRLAEANSVVQKYLQVIPRSDREYAAMQRVAGRCRDLVEREGHLTDVLSGKERVTPLRSRQLATVCLVKKRYGDAVRLFEEAFAAEPALADDFASAPRFEAACAASRAAEQANAAPERTRLLNKAVTWLRADLAIWSRALDGGREPNRLKLLRWVYPWRSEPSLASIRDPEAILAWPPEQQAQCRALWRDVNALVMLAEAAAPSADVDAQIASDLLVQGRERVTQRDWAGAVNSYARTLAYGPNDDGHFWFEYAAVLLLSGDRPGYRAACTHLIEWCGKPGGPRAYHTARAGTLAADGAPDASLLGRLAHNELQQNATEFWSLTERGALAYRAGRFEDSVSFFEQSLEADSHLGRAVVNWLWLALANQRLGKHEEARHWLGKAQEWLDQLGIGMPPDAEELGLHLHNWLEAQILRREAEALILPR